MRWTPERIAEEMIGRWTTCSSCARRTLYKDALCRKCRKFKDTTLAAANTREAMTSRDRDYNERRWLEEDPEFDLDAILGIVSDRKGRGLIGPWD